MWILHALREDGGMADDEILVGFELPGRGTAVERFTKVGTRRAQATGSTPSST